MARLCTGTSQTCNKKIKEKLVYSYSLIGALTFAVNL